MLPKLFWYDVAAIRRRMLTGLTLITLVCFTVLFFVPDGWTKAWNVVSTFAFCAAAAWARDALRLARSGPALVIDDRGLKCTYWGLDPIPWGAVRSLRAKRSLGGSGDVLFVVVDAAAFHADAGRAGRPAHGSGDPDLALAITSLANVDGTLDGVVHAITTRAPGVAIAVEEGG